MTITWFDALLFGIMFISALLALMRGFTREVLSLLSWVGGALAAYFLYPILKDTARSYFPPDDHLVADVVQVSVVFLVVLIIIAILTMRLSDWVLDGGVGVLDRTLGFVFGLARGLLLVVVAYLFFIWLSPREQYPDGVKNAQSIDFVHTTAKVIISYMPSAIAEMLLEKTAKEDEGEDETDAPETDTEEKIDNDASLKDDTKQNVYDGSERSSLNQLLQSTQDTQN